MTHAPTTSTTIHFAVPPGIRCAKDAEPAARALAELMSAYSIGTADDLMTVALLHVCMAAADGETEVVLRTPERTVQ